MLFRPQVAAKDRSAVAAVNLFVQRTVLLRSTAITGYTA
jgi:hypothetical protein